MKRTAILTLAIMIVLSTNAIAIGVTPGLTTVNYKPGEKGTVEFTIINTDNQTIKAEMSSSEGIELEENFLELGPHETRKTRYTYTMAENLEPGTNSGSVTIKEIAEETIGIQAATAVMTRLNIKVPYDGKEIEADIGMEPEENKVKFTIAVTNLGTETIQELNAEIRILNDRLTTETTQLQPQRRTEQAIEWTAPTQGTYKAKITINYDEKSRTTTKEFTTGTNEATYYRLEPKEDMTALNTKLLLAILILLTMDTYLYLRHCKKKRKRKG